MELNAINMSQMHLKTLEILISGSRESFLIFLAISGRYSQPPPTPLPHPTNSKFCFAVPEITKSLLPVKRI